jgi:hypothetical protein
MTVSVPDTSLSLFSAAHTLLLPFHDYFSNSAIADKVVAISLLVAKSTEVGKI